MRDVTDINQTFTVSNLTHQVSPDARFVNGTELSDVQYGIGLVRLPLSGSATTVVAACGNKPFVWSPDGMSAAYIAPTSDPTVQALHVVAGGVDEVAERMPAIPGGFGCESRGQGCDSWTNSILYSQNGAYISFMQQFTRFSVFRIWTSSGSVLKSLDSSKATMQIWSANTLYWQDDTGIRSWRDGTESLAFPGMHWMEPRGSTAGGQIVYQTLDSGLVAHVHVLDLHDGQSLEIASFRSAPAFLTSRYLWYVGDKCSAPCGNPEHGGGFLYDLQTGTESSSSITWLWDAWPHPA